jgi:hypothetical protein
MFVDNLKREVNIEYSLCKRHKKITNFLKFIGVLFIIYGGVGLAYGVENGLYLLTAVGPIGMMAGIYLFFFLNKPKIIPLAELDMFELQGVNREVKVN